ncbi:MAG TPA: ParB/RepB/Spo0J family partition protein [Actinocrinis sp.]|uniref:ParB/RepB/Spo0J family partition protein n=1 Tax=Actinocrinis sp. TaxID=1920516 RepID=UPI002DDCA22C|nr:ParB/RepB/Spo0J family partition protein [Actinocrinis sp.]HEV2346572.1 ParB/RepB/Spo0J family partition protein [Actinocrinis sp.]
MNDRRRGLGRGLGALIPTMPADGTEGTSALTAPAPAVPQRRLPLGEIYRADAEEEPEPSGPVFVAASIVADEVPGAHFAELPLDSIVPNSKQPRDFFEETAMDELVHSIREVGLLQPIVVRPEGPSGTGKYELIMGERRWRAAQRAGLERIPAIVRDTDDERMLLDALLENLHRSQLNPLEEAAAYDQLLKDFSCTHEELADRIGRSRPQVSNTLRLLKLPPKVQLRVASGLLSAGHARALLGLDTTEEQQHLAERIIAEGLSVRTVEEIVAVGDPENGRTRTPRKVRAGGRVAPELSELAGRLSDRLETRVRVDLGARRGKIVVEFASLEDLERIIGTLVPGEWVRARSGGGGVDEAA